MPLRTLVNLAYAALSENRDADEQAQLDNLLAQADQAAVRGRRGPHRGRTPAAPETPAQRLLRAVPAGNAQRVAAMMAQVQATTRTVGE